MLLLISLTSCQIAPPNIKIYKELTPERAYYVSTMSSDEGYIDDEHPYVDEDGQKWTWWQLRAVTLSITGPDVAKAKAYIIKMCKQQNQCGSVKSWDHAVESIDSQLRK